MKTDFKSISRKQYIKFGIAAFIYLLWVIWLGSFLWLLGLPIIFDLYLTRRVNWTFWKKRDQKNSSLVEWIDALIFALVAVSFINLFLFQNFNIPTASMEKSLLIGDYLFVSKVSYGPRVPTTPLSFPLVQHTLPLTKDKNSFLTWIQNPYRRMAGFIGMVKSSRVRPGFQEILLPGELEWRRMQEKKRNGVPLDPDAFAELHKLAVELQVAWPFA
jgi:signal peptidase I